MKKIFAASLLLVFALGCKKGPVVVVKDAGPYQAPQGTTIAESSDRLVSIAIPSGWRRGGPNSMVAPTLAEGMGAMGGIGEGSGELNSVGQGSLFQEDTAAEAQIAADLEKKGILIWVNNSSRPIPGEERTSFRIRRTDGGPMSLEEAAKAAKDNLLNASAIQYVELPIGKVARLEAKTTKIDGGERFEIVYIAVNGEHIYNLKFTTQESPTSVQGIEKEVVDSWRIKPAKAE